MRFLFLAILFSLSCFSQEPVDECGMTSQEAAEKEYDCYGISEDGSVWYSGFDLSGYVLYRSSRYKNEEALLDYMEIVYE